MALPATVPAQVAALKPTLQSSAKGSSGPAELQHLAEPKAVDQSMPLPPLLTSWAVPPITRLARSTWPSVSTFPISLVVEQAEVVEQVEQVEQAGLAELAELAGA